MDRLYFEDFPPGKVVEYGDREVTAEEIVEFAREFDPQPFHLDEEPARETVAGGLIASGWHSAALMMRINCDELFLRSSEPGVAGDRVDRLAEAGPAGRPAERPPHHAQRADVALASRHRRRRGAVRADEPESRSGDAAAGRRCSSAADPAARPRHDRPLVRGPRGRPDGVARRSSLHPRGDPRFRPQVRSAALPSRRSGGGEVDLRRSVRLGLAHRQRLDAAAGRRPPRAAQGRGDARRDAAAARPRQGRARSALVGAGAGRAT